MRPENQTAWYEGISLKLFEYISEIVIKDPEIFLTIKKSDYLNKIQAIIGDNRDFSGITLLAVDPKNVNIPDYDAYSAIKKKYFEYLTLKTEVHNEMIKAENKIYLEAIQKEIDIIRNIEKYGEIITTYPSIIEFLHKANKEYAQEILKDSE